MLFIEAAGAPRFTRIVGTVQGCTAASTAAEASLGRKLFVNALQESKKDGILQ